MAWPRFRIPRRPIVHVYADGSPVLVLDTEAWPVVASASGDDYTGPKASSARKYDAWLAGQFRSWAIAVRQHECGQAVVYGERRDVGANRRDREIVPPGGDVAAAVRRIGASLGAPEDVVVECTAALPPAEA